MFSVAAVPLLVILQLRPRWFPALVNGLFAIATASQIYATWLFGGLLESGLVAVFGILVALAALLILGRRSAVFWFVVYLIQIVFAAAISGRVEPTYVTDDPAAEIPIALILLGVVIMAVTLYFVRQRDRFQRESDDLLLNILPGEIAARLKSGETLIADHYESATVLFADMVDFTPISASMTPEQVIELLSDLFGVFDGFVEELGLEKIRTVGDEYMVVAGVPSIRSDHAHAVSELALRIRSYTKNLDVNGHPTTFRIGINSGPLVAGVVGTRKFSYDLWGDVVNTASRMESTGIAGEIQIADSTHQLIHNDFVCEPRGRIPVKGKGHMETYLLRSRRQDGHAAPSNS